ncbi:endonuclease domain-containing protein [Enterovirga rhinocerotis]|uniref:endonuclease domain-containing protein n=1 Tax=Enterovirga rhinocerotis TaxID=1339210 RepID=UPI001FE0DC79|nr:DUF559 domain-containing protein [Enterovirga rhinocerotis]
MRNPGDVGASGILPPLAGEAISYGNDRSGAAPLPLAGRGRGWGARRCRRPRRGGTPPIRPSASLGPPSPQGGRKARSTEIKRALRRKALAGFRFRRQHPIGPYVLDFYCPEARLALEVDGAADDHPTRAAHDAHRTAWPAEHAIRVLRLPARDVLRGDDAEHVLPTIEAACAECAETLGSSPARPGRWQPQSG